MGKRSIPDHPQFGEPGEGLPRIDRPGAYAVILSGDGRVATISSGGDCHLPGGGIEPGESEEQALQREIREEIGCAAKSAGKVGTAGQYGTPPALDRTLNKVCHYYLIREADLTRAGDGKYEIVWLTPEEAVRTLVHESHAWAVRRALRPSARND